MGKVVIYLSVVFACVLTGCPEYKFAPSGTLKDSQGNPLDYRIYVSMLPLSPPAVTNFSYFPVNTKFNCIANASDLDRVDVRYYVPPNEENGTPGGWTPWTEGKMSDDVTSGSTASDYHIRWEVSKGEVSPLYGSFTTFQGLEPDGSSVDSVTIKAIADDLNRGNEPPETLGANDPAGTAQSVVKIWEVTLSLSRGGSWSMNNDTPLFRELCAAGGKKLGKVNNGDASTCETTICDGFIDGFYDNIEFKGSIPPEVPDATNNFGFPQVIRGNTRSFNGSTWQANPNITSFESDGTLFGDGSSLSVAAGNTDVNEVFALDTPGVVTTCSNTGLAANVIEVQRRYEFETWCTFDGKVVSRRLSWSDSQDIVRGPDGKWKRK